MDIGKITTLELNLALAGPRLKLQGGELF